MIEGSKRVSRNYFLTNGEKRGSLWSLWLKPVTTGANHIYFAGGGFRTKEGKKFGFVFHLSFHRDGRCHIKFLDDKIHNFKITEPVNFPICSIYTHLEDLIVPIKTPRSIIGDIIPIPVKSYSPSDSLNWSELHFIHLDKNQIGSFMQKYGQEEYGFKIRDVIEVGQNRAIYVLSRYLESTKIFGLKPPSLDSNDFDDTCRFTVWSYKDHNQKSIVVYDFAASNTARIVSTHDNNKE